MYASENVLVVADGVGGWADQGVDPGLYSKKLCKIIGQKVEKSLKEYVDNPQKLIVESVK
jgi:protein phosphatase PTC7